MKNKILKANFLTYVKDEYGIIYHSCGYKTGERLAILPVTAVYFPVNNYFYEKVVFDGYESDKENYTKISTDFKKRIEDLRCFDKRTQEYYLGLPISKITKIYEPKQKIERLLSTKTTNLGPKNEKLILYLLNYLELNGIPKNCIGLYGALACDVFKGDVPKDIDIVVYGLKYYPTIVTLSHCNQFTIPDRLKSNPMRAVSVSRRWQLSQFEHPTQPGIKIDVKFIRTEEDTISVPSYFFCNSLNEITIPRATVINAKESLTLPCSYTIRCDGSSNEIVVSTFNFHALGTATNGDIVEVKGIQVDSKNIFLSSPHHYLLCTKI